MNMYIPKIAYIRKTILSKYFIFKDDFEFAPIECKKIFSKKGFQFLLETPRILQAPKTFLDKEIISKINKTKKIISDNREIKEPQFLFEFILIPSG
ncbi:MAG: hypothetical protein K6357_07590 [Elusimicrobiota bacterium]